MKGFNKQRTKTVTLSSGQDTLDVTLRPLVPGQRAYIIGEMQRRHGDDWTDSFVLADRAAMACLGLALGDQIDTAKDDQETWEDYAERVRAELIAANLDEEHLQILNKALSSWATPEADKQTLEDAAGN